MSNSYLDKIGLNALNASKRSITFKRKEKK
jgi:hypothetical protein